MFWLALGIAVAAIGALGGITSARGRQFSRNVALEAHKMWAGTGEPARIDRRRFEGLPAPVRRYAALAIGTREVAVRTVRLRHGGTFRIKLDGSWLPIHGEQYFAADPPGFVWWGRVHVLPGVWVDARDRSVDGRGNMLVSVESSFTLADRSGAEIDQAALLRLLGEMVWFPTALLADRHVIWTVVDDRRARAMLRVGGCEVTGVFEFGEDDLPVAVFGDRYRDLGGGASALTPWSGEFRDYRTVDELLVPHQVVAHWHVKEQRIPYARFQVERLEYDATAPF
jgi:hypothetical protein